MEELIQKITIMFKIFIGCVYLIHFFLDNVIWFRFPVILECVCCQAWPHERQLDEYLYRSTSESTTASCLRTSYLEGQSVLLLCFWCVHMLYFLKVLLTEKHLLANLPTQHLSRLYQSSVPLGWEIFPEWVISFPFNRKLLSPTLLGNKKKALRRLNHTFCCQLVFLISSICSILFYESGYKIPPISSHPGCVSIQNLCATCIALICLQYIITGCMFTSMSSPVGLQSLEDKNYVFSVCELSRIEYDTGQIWLIWNVFLH